MCKENGRFPYEVCEAFWGICGSLQTVKTVTTGFQTCGSQLSCHKLKYLRASYEIPMVLLGEGCVSASCPPEGEKISPEGTPCKTPGSPPSRMLPLLDLLLSGCDKAQIFKTLGLCFHTDFRP